MRDHLATPAPWLAFPENPLGSLFWKMGGGEDYLMDWANWFRAQAKEERDAYLRRFPPPERWSGFIIESVLEGPQ